MVTIAASRCSYPSVQRSGGNHHGPLLRSRDAIWPFSAPRSSRRLHPSVPRSVGHHDGRPITILKSITPDVYSWHTTAYIRRDSLPAVRGMSMYRCLVALAGSRHPQDGAPDALGTLPSHARLTRDSIDKCPWRSTQLRKRPDVLPCWSR